MTKSSIDWTDEVWNPCVGCAKVSAGCKHCYAETMAARSVLMSRALGRESAYLPVVDTDKRRWNGRAEMVPARLADPLRWKRPRRVFVNSMSDLFHEDVTFEFIAACFGVMAATPRHTYQILTKRPARMLAFFEWVAKRAEHGRSMFPDDPEDWRIHQLLNVSARRERVNMPSHHGGPWPLPNVWLGVSTEDQATADERIPLLLDAPAEVRFLSCEPLLGPIHLREQWLLGDFLSCPDETDDPETDGCRGCEAVPSARRCGWPEEGDVCSAIRGPALSWIIAGGESGPGARPCNIDWIRSLIGQCDRARVACFVKQLGANPDFVEPLPGGVQSSESMLRHGEYDPEPIMLRDRKGADPDEWPEDLRVRQYPEAP